MVTRRQIISSGAAVSTSTRKGEKRSPVKRNPNEDTLQVYSFTCVY
jgi:hypothetical protein